MHELSLIQSVFDIIDDHAQQEQFARVISLKLSCGRLSSVEPAAIRFAFEVQSRGTKAEGAALELQIQPVVMYCFSCEREFEPSDYAEACPRCGGSEITLTGGTEELRFLEMEVE